MQIQDREVGPRKQWAKICKIKKSNIQGVFTSMALSTHFENCFELSIHFIGGAGGGKNNEKEC